MSLNLKILFQELNQALKMFNYFFTTTFCLEAMLKVVALGPERYFSEKWNQLDMAIVALSVLGITLEEIEVHSSKDVSFNTCNVYSFKGVVFPVNPTIIRVMRVLR